MKKTILLIALAFTLTAALPQSPVIDTAYKFATAVKVTPVKAKFDDSLNATHLSIRVLSEEIGGTYALLYVRLLNKDGEVVFERNFEVVGTQYPLFVASRMKAYTFAANKLKLTIISP